MRLGWFARARVLVPLAAVPLLGAVLSGCAVSAADLPIPGGGVEGPTYQLTAVFADALNLPDGAHVKLNGDDIGRVRRIEARDYTARVVMAVRQDVSLPRGSTAELRQATPLGEVFVAINPPATPPPGPPLRDGDVIELPATQAAASVEDLLAALSMVVNGGGLAQTQTIAAELNAATTGRAGQIAHLLSQTTTTLATLNARTQDIDRILAASQRLTDTLVARRDSVDTAFADLTPAIRVLADETDRFVGTLHAAGRLSRTGDHLLDETNPQLRSLVRDLGPVLDGFADIGPNLGPSLRQIIGFGRVIEAVTKGESLATNADIVLVPLIAVPGPGDRIGGVNDPVDAERSFTGHLLHQLGTLGGPGPGVPGPGVPGPGVPGPGVPGPGGSG
jgi:phospholipid/cholesterol/gamma-HCH transport system substrate-binding protein